MDFVMSLPFEPESGTSFNGNVRKSDESNC